MISGDPLLDDLTDEQHDAVTTRASPLCIIAGAGSGKTRVLTRRIAWQAQQGHIDPRRVLALTFTRRAAHELRGRLRRLGLRDAVAAGTFHAVALAQLRRRWTDQGRRPPQLLERRVTLLARMRPADDRSTITDLASEIGWARARLITPERYAEQAAAAGRRPPRGPAHTAGVYAEYEAAKRRRRLVDFDDVLALCHATLSRDPEFARAQRWRHRHLFVDEFQDLNPLQFALLRAWLGDESTLVVVGDPDQAIYGWNGADPDLIGSVDRHLPGCAVLYMRTNFRSTPEILAAAGRVLDRDPQPAQRQPGTDPVVTAVEGDEALHVARAVRSCHRSGSRWRHQAVLVRTNAQLPAIREALEQNGIPVTTRGELELARRPEIVEMLERWEPSVALATVVADTTTDLELDRPPPAEATTIEAWLAQARDHLALDPAADLRSFITASAVDERFGAPVDGVELTTFHAAKGLEWPIVHLAGLERGLVPISHARTPAARAEEKRLLHVAVTRAQRELHASWSTRSEAADGRRERRPSPWLDAIAAPASPVAPADPPADLPEVRARVGAAHGPAIESSDLREALLEWRDAMARCSLVRPTVVVDDTAVERIVRDTPRSLDEIQEILGPGRARRWGADLLAMVESHRADQTSVAGSS